jgi:hypothetical protein
MSLWTRVKNMVQNDRLNREIEEEMHLHIEDAVEEGRDPEEARRAFGEARREPRHTHHSLA